jgi:HlyD family secretion protein
VDGIVIKRTVERGQTVAASLQAPELFVIARNLSDMQVDTSVDEADVGRIRPGQKATFTVDAFPGRSFEGEVRQVRKSATNVSNVITYVAVVNFDNSDGRLLPGMTANVRVVTEQRENVLKVPNAALRVRIAGVEPAASAPADGPPGAARPPVPGPSGRNSITRGRLHVLDENGQPVAYNVGVGVGDGSFSEVLVRPGSPAADALKEGASVITGVNADPAAANRPAGPRLF